MPESLCFFTEGLEGRPLQQTLDLPRRIPFPPGPGQQGVHFTEGRLRQAFRYQGVNFPPFPFVPVLGGAGGPGLAAGGMDEKREQQANG
jgi:hypothetical protein